MVFGQPSPAHVKLSVFAFLAPLFAQRQNKTTVHIPLLSCTQSVFFHYLCLMDKFTPRQRHRIMASIKSKDTKPELLVRKYLWAQGFRYRLNYGRLPGHPDLVLRKYRTCIFVNGCFWHGHEGCKRWTLPKTNTPFWENKVKRNQQRDAETQRQLARMGWHCLVVWECQLRPSLRQNTLRAIAHTLNHILLTDYQQRYALPHPDEDEPMMAAEERREYL